MKEESVYTLGHNQDPGQANVLLGSQASNHSEILESILRRAVAGQDLAWDDLAYLLNLSDADSLEQLFAAAREVRQRHFGTGVFLYGFVYYSTYCQNDCSFCNFRRTNRDMERYRKSLEEIIETAVGLAQSGVHLIDLTMGEDPFFLSEDGERLVEIVQLVREKTGLPTMISPGVVSRQATRALADAGADWYALYQETYSLSLYSQLRTAQDFQRRVDAKQYARDCGMLIEEGILTGLGEGVEAIIASFEAMRRMDADQVRVMTYIPSAVTIYRAPESLDFSRELKIIAILRLLFPDRLIPASLDVEGLPGLASRLAAGANVVTSIIPSYAGLAGVATVQEGIDEGERTVAGIAPVLKAQGLHTASVASYQQWLQERRSQMVLA
jgi:methylornithine synthase